MAAVLQNDVLDSSHFIRKKLIKVLIVSRKVRDWSRLLLKLKLSSDVKKKTATS